MQYKASIHKESVVVPGLRTSDDAIVREFGTPQLHQVLRASIAASAWVPIHVCINAQVMILSLERMFAVILMNEGRFLLLIFERNQRKTESTFVIMTTTAIF